MVAEQQKKLTGKKKQHENADGSMSLKEHFSELRKCVFIVAGVLVVAAIVGYYFAPRFIKFALDYADDYFFIQTGVAELMGQYIKVGLIFGIVCAIPVFGWQAYRFASPGLKKSEEHVFLFIMIGGFICFILGAIFCFTVIIPVMLRFFLSINTIDVAGMYDVKEYISFLLSMMVAFGVIFEMPVLSACLSMIGILKPAPMVKARRFEIILCLVIGAIITPTDILSMVMVAVPMMVLYEVSIIICRAITTLRKQRHPEEAEEEEKQDNKVVSERKRRWAQAEATVAAKDAAKKNNNNKS